MYSHVHGACVLKSLTYIFTSLKPPRPTQRAKKRIVKKLINKNPLSHQSLYGVTA
jgi:hypothetical protein